MSEPIKTVERIFEGIIDLFSKKKSGANKLKFFLSFVTIIFIVLPIICNLLALQEQELLASTLSELSVINTDKLTPQLTERYNYLASNVINDRLLVSEINTIIDGFVKELTDNAILLYETEITEKFTYLGFGYKPDIFSSVLHWNLIPLSVIAMLILIVLIIVSDDYKWYKRIIYPILWTLGIECIFAIYSTILAYFMSLLTNRIFLSANITIGLSVFVSLLTTIFLLVKLVKFIDE